MSAILVLPRSFSTTLCKTRLTGGQLINAGGFRTVFPDTIDSDVGGNFDLATGFYTVPSNGLYQITATLRPADQTPAGTQFGLGVHTSNQDGDWFLWHAIQNTLNVQRRTTYAYIRTEFFGAGQQLRLFSYSDQGYVAGTNVMNIFRIA
jgi:hypothetical protein